MTTRMDLRVLDQTRVFAAAIDQSPCDGCDGCGARCTTGVPIMRAEFHEIRYFLASPEGAEARRVETQEKTLPYPGTAAADGFTYVACRFRDVERGRCSIYSVRPVVCRLFGHVEWLPCPIDRIPGPTAGGVEVMRRYSEAPQRTYEEWLNEIPAA